MPSAFKEWALVCEALGSGLQSVIVRKGGLREGRNGFAFHATDFLLFPTWYHEQLTKTRLPAGTVVPPEPATEVEIRYAASIEWSGLVTDWERVCALECLHVLAPAVVAERFQYDESPGVYVAFVRAYRLEPPLRLVNEARYGGCRSWIELPELESCAMVSVLSDEEHSRRGALLEEILGMQSGSPCADRRRA